MVGGRKAFQAHGWLWGGRSDCNGAREAKSAASARQGEKPERLAPHRPSFRRRCQPQQDFASGVHQSPGRREEQKAQPLGSRGSQFGRQRRSFRPSAHTEY